MDAEGNLDPGFLIGSGFSGEDWGYRGDAGVLLRNVAVDSQRRIIAVGSFTRVAGERRIGIVLLLPDGQVDPTFDPRSLFAKTGPDGAVLAPALEAVALQSDDRIVVAGAFAAGANRPSDGILRLLGRLTGAAESGRESGAR